MTSIQRFEMKCYQAWISDNIPHGEKTGNCTIWARVMSQAFPELILVGGYVRRKKDASPFGTGMNWSAFNNSYHEYLITEQGEIVDPTAKQFDFFIGPDKWYYDRTEEHLIYN